LPKVYNPKGKPWITIENSTTEELKDQISHCPSGTLSFIEKQGLIDKKEVTYFLY